MAPQDNNLVTPAYVAGRLGCTRKAVYGWLRAGKMPPPVRVRPMRWERDTVDEWMDTEFTDVDWGDMDTENITEKQCAKCGKVKPISEFYRRTASKDGYQPYCKTCLAENRRKNIGNVRERERRNRAAERRELAWYREHYPQEGTPWET